MNHSGTEEADAWFQDVLRESGTAPVAPSATDAPSAVTELSQEALSTRAPTVAEPGKALPGWEPTEVSSIVSSRRGFRWGVVVLGVLIGLLVAAILTWLPQTSQDKAEARRVELRQALTAVQDALTPMEASMAQLTDSSLETAPLGEATDRVLQLRLAIDDASALIAAPLPAPLPLAPAEPIAELEPSVTRFELVLDAADGLADLAGALIDYRTEYLRILVLPPLAVQTDESQQNQLSVELAAALADTVGAAGDLPDLDAFADHERAITEATSRFERWQVEYLDALRRDDFEDAGALVAEIETIDLWLDSAMHPGLERVRDQLNDAIGRLNADLHDVDVLLAG